MKRVVFGTILVVFLVAPALAQDFSQFGYEAQNRRTVNGLATVDLVDDAGQVTTVSLTDGFGQQENSILTEVNETLRNMAGLTIQELRVAFQRGRADIVVVPRTFRVEGVSLHRYMPSGMQFSYEDTLRFDFRLFVDELFVRVSGQYFGEDQFVERLLRAVDNPVAYIQSQDPQFLFRRLDEQQRLIEENRGVNARQDELREELRDDLESQLSRTEGELTEALNETKQSLSSQIEQSVAEGRAALAALRQEGAAAEAAVQNRIDQTIDEALEIYDESYEMAVEAYNELSNRFSEQIAELRADHEAQISALRESHEQLRADFDVLQAAYAGSDEEFDRSRVAAVTLYTRNLFGGIKPLPAEAVEAIVAAKTAEPGLTIDGVLEQFGEQYEDLGKKHVTAIFAIYFSEYES